MVIGVGVDIISIKRMKNILNDTVALPAFLKKAYTTQELTIIDGYDIPLYRYATHYAGKEAVLKSMNIDGNHICLNEIEISHKQNGQPQVVLYGKLLNIAREKEICQILISLSYEDEYAIAYATALGCS